MKTSYFAQIPSDFPGAIAISRSNPGNSYLSFGKLAPSKELLNGYKAGAIDKKGYIDRYVEETLKLLDPAEVYQELVRETKGREPILLCFEKSGDFCHRHIVSKWFEKKLSITVEELTPEAIAQRKESPATTQPVQRGDRVRVWQYTPQSFPVMPMKGWELDGRNPHIPHHWHPPVSGWNKLETFEGWDLYVIDLDVDLKRDVLVAIVTSKEISERIDGGVLRIPLHAIEVVEGQSIDEESIGLLTGKILKFEKRSESGKQKRSVEIIQESLV